MTVHKKTSVASVDTGEVQLHVPAGAAYAVLSDHGLASEIARGTVWSFSPDMISIGPRAGLVLFSS